MKWDNNKNISYRAVLPLLMMLPVWLNAQCPNGSWTNAGSINVTTSWSFLPCIRGGEYYTFTATAGTPYTFSFCQGGGQIGDMLDPELTIQDAAGNPVGLSGYDNEACSPMAHIGFWTPTVSGTYRILATEEPCGFGTGCGVLAYKSENIPGTGNTCATPRVISSLPYHETGLATCGRGNTYTSAMGPASPYLDGEDMVFSYNGTAGQCLSIFLSNTWAYAGVFLYNGCPGAGGVCIAYNEGAMGNPKIMFQTLPATATYYIVVSTWPLPICTPFDIDVVTCPPAAPTGSVCATPFMIPSLPFERMGLTTCGYGDDYSNLMACASNYMNGDDYVFRYDATGPTCIDVMVWGNTSYTGVFVLDGCPNAGGTTCIEFATSVGAQPFCRYVNLPSAGDYYIVVSTWPAPQCTPFHIKVTPCAPACTSNPSGNNSCSTATLLSPGTDTICGVTSPPPTFTADSPGNLGTQFCGSIENNQWFRITATSSTMSFNIHMSNCANNLGGQVQMFSTPNCNTFTPVSNCYNPMGMWDGVLTASGLTVGGTYYIMVDGFAGDECDFLLTLNQALPVVMPEMVATVNGSQITLDWMTYSEQNNQGFYIQRGEWFESAEKMSIRWEDQGFIEGHGTTNATHAWTFTDQPPWTDGKYYYRLRQVDFNGTSSFSNIVEVKPEAPRVAQLLNVYPNPANAEVKVDYVSNGEHAVAVELRDYTGKLLKQWTFGEEMGQFTRDLDISGIPAGMYLVSFRTGTVNEVRKLNVIR